ncbi:hypothetical protein DRP04_08400 [Archaeoglobales archaeon]|nr:MAG: hypothetical protein DRP04_08400 [Archaeoglobales archaeon]
MFIGDFIKEVFRILAYPIKEAGERITQAGADIASKIKETMEDVFARGYEFFFPQFLERLKMEIAKKSIDENLFQTKEIKEAVKKLKEKWSHSPEGVEDLAEDIMDIVTGKVAKLQLEAIAGVEFGKDTPISEKLFNQVAIITDICLLSNILQIVGEILSIGQIDTLGKEIREYLDYSGLSQIVGFGYGMLLSSVLSPLIAKEINYKLTPEEPTVTEALRMYYRGILKEEDFKAIMRRHGFSDTYINALKQDYLYYPTPTDFIRFSVREVFSEDKETKEALEAEFPEDIVEYAEKAGMRRDVLMWYWKAHWELPSPTQVYEMLHRLSPEVLKVRGKAYESMGLDVGKLETTLDTVKTYLKQADYDLRWRDKLVAISYSPLTRVDLRRIFALGLITEEELIARLMELGYTKEDAQLIAEFYKQYAEEEGREWTKSEIKYLLYYGIINEQQAIIYLQDLGYSEESAKALVELWKAKLEEKDMREHQKYVRDAFAEGLITEEEAREQLTALGLSEDVVDVVIAKEKARRQRSYKNPSPDKVVKWLKAGIITEEEARDILKEINVREKWIDYYIKEAKA